MHVRTYFAPWLRRRRKQWGKGPWTREPDGAWFSHAGFACVCRRVAMGHWCGYVMVPAGHPWHGMERTAIVCRVHGEVTWSERGAGETWEVGFDCGHSFDTAPSALWIRGGMIGLRSMLRIANERAQSLKPKRRKHARKSWQVEALRHYRSLNYAIAMTMHLANQAREAANEHAG